MSKGKLQIGGGSRTSSVTKSDQMLDFKYREGPVIRTRQSIPQQSCDFWENTLIGKLYVDDHTETTSSLIEDIKNCWDECYNSVRYSDLGNNFISLTFENADDKQGFLDLSPHSFFGHLLIIREWPLPHQQPNIRIISKQLTFTTSPFWIQAQGVPREFWSKEIGMDLGRVAGEVMKVDYGEEESEKEDDDQEESETEDDDQEESETEDDDQEESEMEDDDQEESETEDDDQETEEGLRFRVMVDITRSLALGSWLCVSKDNFLWISFKYEELPFICYRCGLLGHIKKNCRTSLTPPSIGTEMTIDLPNGSSSERPVVPGDHQVLIRDLTKRGYGPWIYHDIEDVLNEDEVEMLSDVEEDI